MKTWSQLTALLLIALGGCYDAGPHGFDHHYVPLDDEEAFIERGQEAVFNEVRTDPEDFNGVLISWFGVAEQVDEAEGGATLVRMSFRTHQERHLCYEQERDTCRVTVSQASSGTFSAQLQLSPSDAQGQNRIAPGSLLGVSCQVTGQYVAEGGPLLECEHYRHWPRGVWAHTGMRSEMRR